MAGVFGNLFSTKDEFELRIDAANDKIKELNADKDSFYYRLGKRFAEEGDLSAFPDMKEQYDAIIDAVKAQEAEIVLAREEKVQREKAEAAALAARTCKKPGCGHVNNPDSSFCQLCGSRLGVDYVAPAAETGKPCPTCGQVNSASAVFCQFCGTKYGEPMTETVPVPELVDTENAAQTPAEEKACESVANNVAEPVAEPVIEPIAEPVAEPAVEIALEAKAEAPAEEVSKPQKTFCLNCGNELGETHSFCMNCGTRRGTF